LLRGLELEFLKERKSHLYDEIGLLLIRKSKDISSPIQLRI